MKDITKETGVRVTVAPITLPDSNERVVKIGENKGSIMNGLKQIISKIQYSNTDLDLKKYKPLESSDNITTKNYGEMFFSLKSNNVDNLLRGRNKILELSKKLGITISISEDGLVCTRGPTGALSMCRDILGEEDEIVSTASTPLIPKVDCPTGPDMTVTSTLLAMTCNLNKKSN